jgi:hypothetical protein
MKHYLLLSGLLLSLSLFSQDKNSNSINEVSDSFKRIAQDCMESNDIKFDIKKTFVPFTISKSDLNVAVTVKDLRPIYNPAWIREFISVTVSATINGTKKQSISKSDKLSKEQLSIMNMADVQSPISLVIKYIPENTLVNNSEKEIDYTFIVSPEKEAQFNGGKKEMELYLKEKIINKLTTENFDNQTFASVVFEVNTLGEIINAKLSNSSKNENTDQILLESIQSMPNWTPAEYKNGKKEIQKFAFILGNMESCAINLLELARN